MATIEHTFTRDENKGDACHVFSWVNLLADPDLDVGQAVKMCGSDQRVVQVLGSFPGPSRVSIEGSNNDVDYEILRDPLGTDLDFSAPGIRSILEVPRFTRPRITGGTAATGITVLMMLRKRTGERRG